MDIPLDFVQTIFFYVSYQENGQSVFRIFEVFAKTWKTPRPNILGWAMYLSREDPPIFERYLYPLYLWRASRRDDSASGYHYLHRHHPIYHWCWCHCCCARVIIRFRIQGSKTGAYSSTSRAFKLACKSSWSRFHVPLTALHDVPIWLE